MASFLVIGSSSVKAANTPYVVSVYPANNSTHQNTLDPIVITFSEIMNPSSLVFSTNPPENYTATWTDSKTVSLAHSSYSHLSAQYMATISAANSAEGVALSGLPYSWSFYTAPIKSTSYSTSPVDQYAPTNVSVSINNGATVVNSTSVTLGLAATGATEMIIGSAPDFYGMSWESFASTRNWVLSSGSGSKTVYAQFRDAAHNLSPLASATVTLDYSYVPPAAPSPTPAPTSMPSPMPIPPGLSSSIDTSGNPSGNIMVGILFLKSLSLGSTGIEVSRLQMFLKNQGKDIYPEGLVTGYFGLRTRAAVGRFQIKYGIVTSINSPGYGNFGPLTRAKVNDLI